MITEQIDKLLGWLCGNKEWIFSGIGLTVISFIARFFSKRKKAIPETINQVPLILEVT